MARAQTIPSGTPNPWQWAEKEAATNNALYELFLRNQQQSNESALAREFTLNRGQMERDQQLFRDDQNRNFQRERYAQEDVIRREGYDRDDARAQRSIDAAYARKNDGEIISHPYDLIRKKEGFREKPYWDVDAWRIGYGSDTITRPDGSVVRVAQGMRVSREDAERDLARRVNREFIPSIIDKVGDAWSNLPAPAQAALTSITYNYGTLPSNVANAVRSGNPDKIVNAIEALRSHNKGVNAGRRQYEADLVRRSFMMEQPTPNVPETVRKSTTAEDFYPAAQFSKKKEQKPKQEVEDRSGKMKPAEDVKKEEVKKAEDIKPITAPAMPPLPVTASEPVGADYNADWVLDGGPIIPAQEEPAQKLTVQQNAIDEVGLANRNRRFIPGPDGKPIKNPHFVGE
jgi:GH24 family phage-related lysozyme (muramidase)